MLAAIKSPIRRVSCLLLACGILLGCNAATDASAEDQLLRLAYDSAVTGAKREYFVYLPNGYANDEGMSWPVMLFLHGNGERGDGLGDLDYVLTHGPLMEAWIQRRELPFIIISPQLPIFGELDAIAERREVKPRRLDTGVPERNYGFPSELAIQRTDADDFPDGMHRQFGSYPDLDRLPAGWDRIDTELLDMVDTVLEQFSADPDRVYLTGLSMGGFGSFHLAANYPDRWAAVATIVATGRLEDAQKLADSGLPMWMFGGGKDTLIKPHWLYEMARALEEAGHTSLRFTVHEDMDHDAWKRVYEGSDLYNWFLRFNASERPKPEKSIN